MKSAYISLDSPHVEMPRVAEIGDHDVYTSKRRGYKAGDGFLGTVPAQGIPAQTFQNPTEYWAFDATGYTGLVQGIVFDDDIFVSLVVAKRINGVNFPNTGAVQPTIIVNNSTELNFVGDKFSASVWFKITQKPVGLVPSHTLFEIDLEDVSGNFKGALAVRIRQSDVIRLQVTDSGSNNNIVDTPFDPGLTDFHLMVVTYDRVTGLAKLYVDNVLLATSSASTIISPSDRADFLVVARTNAGPTPGSFIVDELGVWLNDFELSSDNRDTLWDGGAGTFYPFS